MPTATNPLFKAGCVYEVRIFKVPNEGTVYGYFDDEDKMWAAIKKYDGRVKGIYITLNPVKPELLKRSPNCLTPFAKKGALTHDDEIVKRVWLMFDLDAKRPTNTSSTDAEHQAAYDKAIAIKAYLTELGWTEPIECDSGNGWHLLYPIDLPNDEESAHLVEAVLDKLAEKFDDEQVKVDPSVHNASRITKLYGTMTGKGPDTEDRPHRQSKILKKPKKLVAVSKAALEAITKKKKKKPSGENKHDPSKGKPQDEPSHRLYTEEEIAEALAVVPADDRDDWMNYGIILGRYFNRSEKAWNVYVTWANKWRGEKAPDHDERMDHYFHKDSQEHPERELGIGTILAKAKECGWVPKKKGKVPTDKFVYSMEDNAYIYLPTGKACIAAAVDATCEWVGKTKPSLLIRSTNPITSTTCDPNIPGIILKGFDYVGGYPKAGIGAATLNRYRPPEIVLGDATLAGPFLDHVKKVFSKSGDADMFLDYLAHRRQKPGEKPHFALVIGGEPGVGKDTAVEACVDALGGWNVIEIPPTALDRDFNAYAIHTLVRISEVGDTKEMSRWQFYERIKTLITGEHVEINPKYGRTYSVRLYCAVIITTNHLDGGIFIGDQDRRYDIIEAASISEMGFDDAVKREKYFNTFYTWLHEGGRAHVAAYLQTHDLKNFHPHINRKTDAWHRLIQRGLDRFDWCRDALEHFTNRNMVSGSLVLQCATLTPERARKLEVLQQQLSHAMKALGYVVHENPDVKDGRWKLNLEVEEAKSPAVWHRIYRKKDYHPEKGEKWQVEMDRSLVGLMFPQQKAGGGPGRPVVSNVGTGVGGI